MPWRATHLWPNRERVGLVLSAVSLSTKDSGVSRARKEDKLTWQKWDSTLTFTDVLGAALAVATVGEGPGIWRASQRSQPNRRGVEVIPAERETEQVRDLAWKVEAAGHRVGVSEIM